MRFFLDQLGFSLVADYRYGASERWVAVAPADGSAVLALVTPKAGSEEYDLIGRSKQIVFVTEDVPAKFQEWSNRGVQFHHPLHTPEWGGTFTSFEDADGNSFVLVGFDEVGKSKHNAAPLKRSWNLSAVPARNLKLQNRCKQGSFRKRCRRSKRSTTRVFASKLVKSEATTMISLILFDIGLRW